ncbi:MAG: WYL domain-containing protein [Rhodomicrobiaceae bacterium]
MISQFANAIENLNLIKIEYDGGSRIIEPHALGLSSKNNPVLRAFQQSGHSQSGQYENWKLLRLDRVENYEILSEKFLEPRKGYKENDSHMKQIIAQLFIKKRQR